MTTTSEEPTSSSGGVPEVFASGALFDIFLWLTIFGALGLLLWLCIYVSRAKSKKDSVSEAGVSEETPLGDWNALRESVRDYVRDHRFVFVILFALSTVFYIAFAGLALGHHKPSRFWTAEDAFLALSSGVGCALIILMMTDFAAKRLLRRTLDRQKSDFIQALGRESARVVSTLQEQELICRIYRETGLHALPSVREHAPSFETLFGDRHADCESIKVISTSGANWLRFDEAWERNDPLPHLVSRAVRLQLLIYSPVLHFRRIWQELHLVSEEGDQSQRCLGWCDRQETALSADPSLAMLRNHLEFHTQVSQRLRKRPITLEIRVTNCLLPSSFFIVDDRAVYATFPMKMRRHDKAIAVSAFARGSEFDVTAVVDSFSQEFNHFWERGMDFDKYMNEEEPLIREVIALSARNRSPNHREPKVKLSSERKASADVRDRRGRPL